MTNHATNSGHNLAAPHAAWVYHAAALTTILIWSFSFLFIIKLNRELTPVGVVVLRMDIFGLVLLAALVVRRPPLRHLRPRDWLLITAVSLVGGPFYHQVFSWSAGVGANGESRIDAALLGLILATVPIHAGWLAWLFLRERLGVARLVALTCGLAGVAVVIWGRFGSLDLWPSESREGPLAATLAAMLGGGMAVLTRAARHALRPLDLVMVSGLMMVMWNALLHPWAGFDRIADMTTIGWVAAVFLGVFGLGVAFVTWATALAGLPTVTVATYLFLASVLAALWGWLFDGTSAGWAFVLGAALVLAGLMVMTRADTGRRPRPSQADGASRQSASACGGVSDSGRQLPETPGGKG